jgi:hypothetical protein
MAQEVLIFEHEVVQQIQADYRLDRIEIGPLLGVWFETEEG